ncbi:MAG: prepilin-type N-terminal cleavage/methylation domain-containing protein [Planctomycetota bacterium]
MNRRSLAKGFTLVEILIVVVILGILAAIVIPQFSNASESAKVSSLQSQLQTIRSQVELYKNQHNGDFPTADGLWNGTWDWAKMTETTDVNGATTGNDYGPYLQSAPVNGVNNQSAVGTAAGASVGWVITATGKITAAIPTTYSAESDIPASDKTTY